MYKKGVPMYVLSLCHTRFAPLSLLLNTFKLSVFSLSLSFHTQHLFCFLNMSYPLESPSRQYESITRDSDAAPEVTRTHTNGSRVGRTTTNGSRILRSESHLSHKEIRDPNLDVNLPYRTLSPGANLEEYTVETPEGEVKGSLEPDGQNRYNLVTFTPNDPENPKNWSKGYKWYCTMVVAVTCFVVAFASSVITADIVGVQEAFNVSEEVGLASISVFVVGFGIGMRLPGSNKLTTDMFRPHGLCPFI